VPTITFAKEIGVKCNGEKILLVHVDHAHTYGDALIYFPESDVLHMGDVYFNGSFPYIDLSSGGSIDGMIAAVEKALFIVGENTRIIPGHGALSDRAELAAYHSVLKDMRDQVKHAIDEGKEEIKAMKPGKDRYETWGTAFISPERFIDLVHSSLVKEAD